VIDSGGELAKTPRLLLRWLLVWLPLLLPTVPLPLLYGKIGPLALLPALAVILLWLGGATHAVLHPDRGLPDRMARTWIVRR